MKKQIDEIKVIYTPKHQMSLQTFLCFYPITTGAGTCIDIEMKHSDGTDPKYNSIMEANIEYVVTIRVYAFAKYMDFNKSSHP